MIKTEILEVTMSKTLKSIQKIAKWGRALSKIVYVFSIIGVVICALAFVILLVASFFGGGESRPLFVVGGRVLATISITDSRVGQMAFALCMCIAEVRVSRKAVRFFVKELEEKNPFTFDSAERLKKLGVSVIVTPLIASIVGEIVFVILDKLSSVPQETPVDTAINVSLGIMFIVTSLILKYGAEQFDKKQETEA